MKQVTQRLKDGVIEVRDVPPPALTAEGVIVDIRASLLSAGTERTKVETARRSIIGKARSRPDQVRAVIDKARRDGLKATADAVRARLDEPSTLGYSAAGVVTEVGARVRGIAAGDRVACAGGTAVHAELVQVPGNLCVRLPEQVGFTEGAFTTVGSIALHAVRQGDVRLGERVGVIGLGLIGQLAAQLLKAAGCRVVGIDLSDELVGLAQRLGSIDHGTTPEALERSRPPQVRDCDAVLLTAATRSDDPVELAADLCRDRGRVVVVGDVGLSLPRAPYYEKEIELRLSRSYGPGRYDREYEERGLDYPIGYVRWTERRNMEAFVDLVAAGKVDVASLVSDRVSIDEAPAAYERLLAREGSPLGIVLEYEPTAARGKPQPRLGAVGRPRDAAATSSPAVTGVIGAGSFAQRILIPALKEAGFELARVASAAGLSAQSAAERFGFGSAATADEIIADPEIGLVAIATRHSSHARLASSALRAGKAVFVEKPPCLTVSELAELRAASWESGLLLACGFNRRHAPFAKTLRDHVAGHGPAHIIYRVKPDPLPADHWLLDPDEGGGPLIGEGCHFVDLACWIAGGLPERVCCAMRAGSDAPIAAAEDFTATLEFADGSLATIAYGPAGARAVGKEYLEVHAGDRSAVLDDFRRLELYTDGDKEIRRARGQDKGHTAQIVHLRAALERKSGPDEPESTSEPDEIDPLDTMQVTLAALASARTGRSINPTQEAPDAEPESGGTEAP